VIILAIFDQILSFKAHLWSCNFLCSYGIELFNVKVIREAYVMMAWVCRPSLPPLAASYKLHN
jgi:hypothetical protein